jgi:WhiB family redox-sensing transcriptional regulator
LGVVHSLERFYRRFLPKGGLSVSAQRTGEEWQLRAACRGPQAAVFFPPGSFERKDEKLARESRAKEICRTCPSKKPCLEYAIAIREPHGIWGGLSETERKAMLIQAV